MRRHKGINGASGVCVLVSVVHLRRNGAAATKEDLARAGLPTLRLEVDFPFFVSIKSLYSTKKNSTKTSRGEKALTVTEGANFIFPIAFCWREALAVVFMTQ